MCAFEDDPGIYDSFTSYRGQPLLFPCRERSRSISARLQGIPEPSGLILGKESVHIIGYVPEWLVHAALLPGSGYFEHSVIGYVDPNTMHHVFTFFAPMLALLTAAAGLVATTAFYLRSHAVRWLRKATRVQLVMTMVAVASVVIAVVAVAWHLATNK